MKAKYKWAYLICIPVYLLNQIGYKFDFFFSVIWFCACGAILLHGFDSIPEAEQPKQEQKKEQPVEEEKPKPVTDYGQC